MKLPSSFNNGKIYIIRFLNNDNHIYIGSTIKSLKDWSKCLIELYLNYPCKTSRELVKKEYQIINKFSRNKSFAVLNIMGNKNKK